MDRASQRSAMGDLRSLIVSPSMLKRYEYTVLLFRRFVLTLLGVAIATHVEELDAQLVSFIETAWLEGEPIATASDAICGVQHFMNRKRCFPGVWRYYTTWTKHELPNRTPPLPWIAPLEIVGSMVGPEVRGGSRRAPRLPLLLANLKVALSPRQPWDRDCA